MLMEAFLCDGVSLPCSVFARRGPQLNPVRDPQWGRCSNSPGEDAYVHGEYETQIVLAGQGAHPGRARTRTAATRSASTAKPSTF